MPKLLKTRVYGKRHLPFIKNSLDREKTRGHSAKLRKKTELSLKILISRLNQ